MLARRSGFLRAAAMAGCGVLAVLANPPYDLWWLSFVLWWPWLWAIEGLTPRRAFFYGWIAGIVGIAWGFFWINELLIRFSGFPFALSVPVVLLFAVWYAMADHFGQETRAAGGTARAVFAFPQNNTRYPGYERWVPGFIDYLFVSMCMSSAMGPGDAVALARPVKLLMMLQTYLALVVVVVLAARAIGLIG